LCREGHLQRRGDPCNVERNIAEKRGLQTRRKGGTLQRRVEYRCVEKNTAEKRRSLRSRQEHC